MQEPKKQSSIQPPPTGQQSSVNQSVASLLPASLRFEPCSFDFTRIPAGPGVFLLETAGEPFLGKSMALRRRLQRLLGPLSEPLSGPLSGQLSGPSEPMPTGTSDGPRAARRLNLRAATAAIRYRATGSVFENSVLLYHVARAAFPQRYRELFRLRPPPLLKVNLANPYPRCYVTRRLGRGPALYYGPFPTRAAAEKFAPQIMDLFLVRRCVESIHPDPAHPGCIYGEMSMCLRPCQDACTHEQYREEVERLAAFFSSGGSSLVKVIEAEREGASGRLDFEEAARLHRRLEKVEQALKHRPELAMDLERLNGLVIQPSAQSPAVELFPLWRGFLLPQLTFTFEVVDGRPVSLDARLRELLLGVAFGEGSARSRAEQLALLARWYYRGTRVGEFVPFDSYQQLPFRKIVGAISRVARHAPTQPVDRERSPAEPGIMGESDPGGG